MQLTWTSKTYLRATALTLGGALLLVLLGGQPSPWDSWRQATCMPGDCFCEAVRAQLLRQPSNAVTSLAFVPTALFCFACARRDTLLPRPGATLQPLHSWLLGIALLLIGLGSAFYHASLTFVGQTADVFGMNLFASFLLVYAAATRFGLRERSAAGLFVGGNVALLVVIVALPELRRYAFGALVVLALVLLMESARYGAARHSPGRLLAALLSFALALGFWVLDLWGAFSSPDSLLQGHALWHLGCGFAAAQTYAYLRSGRAPVGAL